MRTTSEEVKHKRAVQGAMSIGTATIGLAALGAKGGSMALKRYPKALRSVTRVKSKSLNNASLSLTTAGAGLGGASGYHFAALQRAENKAEHERENNVTKMLEYSSFGVIHKAYWDETVKPKVKDNEDNAAKGVQTAGYAGAVGGVGGALMANEIQDARLKPTRDSIISQKRRYLKAKKQGVKAEDKLGFHREARDNLLGNRADTAPRPVKNKSGKMGRKPKASPYVTEQGKNRATAMGLDDHIAGAAKYTKKSREAYQNTLGAKSKIKTLRRTETALKTSWSVPKIRAVALGVGGASLAASEVARQHRRSNLAKNHQEWWS